MKQHAFLAKAGRTSRLAAVTGQHGIPVSRRCAVLKAALYSTLPLLALALASPAYAQTTVSTSAPGTPSGDQGAALETIVVTASKSRSALQETPIAVSQLSAVELDKSNITTFSELNGQLPGLVINQVGGDPLNISVRGLGFPGIQNASSQPGVSFNENGVYIASPFALNSDFLDVDQIELLRGPQGTVLGQNSDGGALNLTTIQPKLGEYSGYGDISYGSYNLVRARAAANLPVGDTAALRIAVQQNQHDGWSKETKVAGQPDYPVSDENAITARITGLWQPTDKLSITAWAEHYKDGSNGPAQKNIFDPDPDPRRITGDYPQRNDVQSDIFALQADYDFDFATLKTIGSYQYVSSFFAAAADKLDLTTALKQYGVHDVIPVSARDENAFTGEVDLVSTPGTQFDWIVGAFILHQDVNQGVVEFTPKVAGTNFAGSLSLTPTTDQGEVANGLSFESRSTEKHNSESIYGQITYHITDALDFTGGARLTHDSASGSVSNSYAVPKLLSAGFDAITGKAEFQYKITPQNSAYAMFSSGVKPGGTDLNTSALVVPQTFKPEYVNAYELGSKNDFMDHRLRLNVSAFYNDISNYQVESEDTIPFQGGIDYLKKAYTYGLEAEGSALLPDDIRLDGNFALTQGTADSDDRLLDPVLAQQINRQLGLFSPRDLAARGAAFQSVKGKNLPNIAPFSSSFSISKNFDMGDLGSVSARAQFIYRTSYDARIFNVPSIDKVPPSRQWNLYFSYDPPSSFWYAEFLVVNLTDSDSIATRFGDNFGQGEVSNLYIPPRQFIARLHASF
jgi:iron complex outermembrane receptor protein